MVIVPPVHNTNTRLVVLLCWCCDDGSLLLSRILGVCFIDEILGRSRKHPADACKETPTTFSNWGFRSWIFVRFVDAVVVPPFRTMDLVGERWCRRIAKHCLSRPMTGCLLYFCSCESMSVFASSASTVLPIDDRRLLSELPVLRMALHKVKKWGGSRMTSKMITGTWYSELQVEEQGNKTRIRRSEYDQLIPVVGQRKERKSKDRMYTSIEIN